MLWKRMRRVVLLVGFAIMQILPSAISAKGSSREAVTYPYPVGDKGDLWLLAGQSNMAGFGTLKQELEPDPRILFFANDNEWTIAKDPLERLFFPHGSPHGMVPDYTHLPVGGAGLGRFFARHVIEVTNRPMGLIGVAEGGPMCMFWDPRLMDNGQVPPAPYIYGRMIQRVMEGGEYGKLKGMIWYEGESDSLEGHAVSKLYEENLLRFVDGVRRDTGNPDLPVLAVQLSRYVTSSLHLPGTAQLSRYTSTLPGLPSTSGGEALSDAFSTYTEAWEHVREVQRLAAQKRKNVYVVASLDLYPMVDPIHLDFGAFQRLGPRLAEVALSEIYNLTGHGKPIQLASIQVGPMRSYKTSEVVHGRTIVRVRFNGVTGNLHAYGRPSGFSLRFPEVGNDVLKEGVPVIYATEFDPKDPAAVLLLLTGDPNKLKETFKAVLYYGAGLDPYCNIVDEKDIAVPAFGPIALGLAGEVASYGHGH